MESGTQVMDWSLGYPLDAAYGADAGGSELGDAAAGVEPLSEWDLDLSFMEDDPCRMWDADMGVRVGIAAGDGSTSSFFTPPEQEGGVETPGGVEVCVCVSLVGALAVELTLVACAFLGGK